MFIELIAESSIAYASLAASLRTSLGQGGPQTYYWQNACSTNDEAP